MPKQIGVINIGQVNIGEVNIEKITIGEIEIIGGDTPIYEGQLLVGDSSPIYGYFGPLTIGEITPNTFEYQGATYTITQLATTDSISFGFVFSGTPIITSGNVNLEIDGQQATVPYSGNPQGNTDFFDGNSPLGALLPTLASQTVSFKILSITP